MSVELDITSGDPLYRLEHRLRLKTHPFAIPIRHLLALVAVSWLPLAILAQTQGQLFGFLKDPIVVGRLLASVPLLVLASPFVARSIAIALSQFVTTGLVAPEDGGRFEAAVDGAMRLRDSRLAIWLIVVASVALAFFGGRGSILPYAGAWAHAGTEISPGGWWFLLVSLTLFDVVRLRWLWRVIVWWRFMISFSRIPLRLMPAHPDRVGGLGLLSNAVGSFAMVIFGLNINFGCDFRVRMVTGGVKLATLAIPIIGIPVFFLLLVLAPIGLLVPRLFFLKWQGQIEYGKLAARYNRRFEERWLSHGDSADAELLGTGDIQSMADMANSYDVMSQLRPIPLTLWSVAPLVAAAAAAMLPAIVAEYPLKEIVLTVLKAIR